MSKMEKEKIKHRKKKRLIIRNLSFDVSEEELHGIVSKFGNVLEVNIPVKKDGKKRGFAFVEYEDTPSMIKAMKALNYSDIKGRKIAIDFAVDKTTYELKIKSIKEENSSKCNDGIKSEPKSDESDNESNAEDSVNPSIKNDLEDEKEARVNEFLREFNAEYEAGINESSDESSEEETDSDEEQKEDIKLKEIQQIHSPKSSNSQRNSQDVSEGKTVFLRNVAFTTSQEELSEAMEEYGECEYCVICVDSYTNHSRGTAFVKFKDKESADKLIADSLNEPGVLIDGRKLTCSLAVSKEAISQQSDKNKKPKDKRNLNLLKIGVIMPEESGNMSRSDMIKRNQLEILKKQKLRNVNFFVSDKRLMIHNLPKTLNDTDLRKLFKQAAGKGAVITEARVMKEFKKTNAQGIPLSKGFGFVSFSKHEDALKSLLFLNNNPSIFTDQKRPIVEFSVENKVALLSKEKRKERIQMRNKKRTEEKSCRIKQNANNQKEVSSKAEMSPKKNRKKIKMNTEGDEENNSQNDQMLQKNKSKNKKKRNKKEKLKLVKANDENFPQNDKTVEKNQLKSKPKKKKKLQKSSKVMKQDHSSQNSFNNMVSKFKEKLLNKI